MDNSVPLKPSCRVTILMMAGQDYFRWKNLNVGGQDASRTGMGWRSAGHIGNTEINILVT